MPLGIVCTALAEFMLSCARLGQGAKGVELRGDAQRDRSEGYPPQKEDGHPGRQATLLHGASLVHCAHLRRPPRRVDTSLGILSVPHRSVQPFG